ncbi:MAG: SH3 domain-containing protein [Thermomicrobiales bacterium]
MSTATTGNHSSIQQRVCTLALAGLIAAGALLPGSSSAFADGDPGRPAPVATTQASAFSVSGNDGQLTGLNAVIAGSGDGVNLRADAAHDGSIVTTLTDGTVVDLRIDMVDTVRDPDGVTRWWPVSVGGKDGWVSGYYLKNPDAVSGATVAPTVVAPAPTAGATSPATSAPFDFTGEIVAGIQVEVSGGGNEVNLRATPAADGDVVARLNDGSTIALRIDSTDTVADAAGTRWWPVTADGKDGWVSGAYLRSTSGSGTTPTQTPSGQTATYAAGSYVRINTQSGDGAIVRAEPNPNGAQLKVWADGQVAQVMEGPLSFESSVAGWYKVTTGDLTGYVDGDLLVVAGQPSSTSDVASSTTFIKGANAQVKTQKQMGVNIRENGDPTAAKVGYVPEAGIVRIVDGPVSHTGSTAGWFQITSNGVTGYVDGDLLVATTSPSSAASTSSVDEGVAGNFRKGDYVIVATASRSGANVRSLPSMSSDVSGFLAEAGTAQVIDGPIKDENGDVWYKVSNGGDTRGWVAGNLLDPANDPAAVASTATAPAATTPSVTQTPSASGNQPTTTPVPTTAAVTTPAPSTGNVSAQGFIYPLASYTITQGFGCSDLGFYAYDPTLGCPIHDGLDLAAPAGSPIMAAAAGTVVAAGWCDCGLGNYVEIDHGNGVHTLYGHMQSQPYVSVGQQVAQGDVIGPVGSTGLSTGPHTHFMVTIDGVAQNPQNYLP